MTIGNTTTGSLADSLNTMVAEARIVREQEGVMSQLVDKRTLDEGTGLDWKEISLSKLTAQAVTETTVLNNPQQVEDTAFTITPTVVGLHTCVTRKVQARIARSSWVELGKLAQNAIQRKKDEDGLVVLDGATTSLSGAGTTLVSGVIAAASVRITSNATEPAKPPIRAALHGFQIKDIYDELTAGISTYPIPDGVTATVFRDGFRGKIHGVEIFEDGNITIDSLDDGKGGVFAKEGIVLVQGRAPWKLTREEPEIGGGADSIWLYDEYAYGERSPGNWLFEIYSDCTAPTS